MVRSGLRETRVVTHTSMDYDPELGIADKARVIGDIVNDIISRHRITDFDIALTFPRDLIVVREVQMPLSVKENLRTTLGYELHKYIPLPPNDVYYDYLITTEDKTRQVIKMLLFAIRRQDGDQFLILQEYLGQRISGIGVAPLAMTASLVNILGSRFTERCVGLIHVGCVGGDVSVYDQGRLAFSRYIRGHSAAGTEGLALDLNGAMADAAGRQSDASVETDWYYIVDAGAEGIADRLTAQTDLPLTQLDGGALDLPSAALLPAYGVAVHSLQRQDPQINLLPPGRRRKPSRLGYYLTIGLTLLVLVTGIAWGASAWLKHRMAMNQLDDALANLQQEVLAVESIGQQNDGLLQRLDEIGQLHQAWVPVLTVLQELSVRVPLSAWIQDLNFQKGNVQISGYADSASDLLEILEASPVFDEVAFLAAITRTQDGKERFRISMGIE
jgi:general secretion pathway protein L